MLLVAPDTELFVIADVFTPADFGSSTRVNPFSPPNIPLFSPRTPETYTFELEFSYSVLKSNTT